jgi:hypothetical protein
MAFGTVNTMPGVRIGPPGGNPHSPPFDGRGDVSLRCDHNCGSTPGKAVRQTNIFSVGPRSQDQRTGNELSRGTLRAVL